MDDRSAWTPGEMPESLQPAVPTWGPSSGPGAADPRSSYPGPDGDPASSYPPPGTPSPYGPPAGSSPYPLAGQGSYGAPGPGGYPPLGPGQPYGNPPPYGAYAPYAPNPGTDGFAIAALVFGILGGWLSLVFGPLALSRIKKSGASGRGMAIAGIWLGAAWVVGGILLAIAIPVFLNQRHLALHDECANGNMAACDSLFNSTHDGTAEHTFGDTCGGRTPGGYECTSLGEQSTT